jgi:signal transduction histidine kinase
MKLQKELDILSDEDYYNNLDNIIEKTKYLSDIINTFTNFIKEENKETIFNLQEKMDETVNIISNTLANNNITLVKIFEDEPIEIRLIASYLSHAILNIITNAKDVILDRNIKDGKITLRIQKFEDYVEIIIEDNAGGIEENLIDKIFDPYFTTKHQSQGVGMGLHNSYNFIVNELNGKLYVENGDNGARFFIRLAL